MTKHETFEEWIASAAEDLSERLGELATVTCFNGSSPWGDGSSKTKISIGVHTPLGELFWCTFHTEEYKRNNPEQRKNVVKRRLEGIALTILDYVEDLEKLASLLENK